MGETNVYIQDLPSEVDDAGLTTIFGQYGTVTWAKVMPSKGKPTSVAIVEFSTPDEAQWFVENLNGNIPEGLTTPINAALKKSKKGKDKGKGYGKSADDGGKWGGKASEGKGPYGGGKATKGKEAPAWQPTWAGKGGADSGKQAAAWKPTWAGKGGEEQAAAPQTQKESNNVYITDLPSEVDDNMVKEIFGQYGTVTWAKVMASKGKPTTMAIVEFATKEESEWFVENLNGNIPEGLSSPIKASLKKEKGEGKGKAGGKGGWQGGKGGWQGSKGGW